MLRNDTNDNINLQTHSNIYVIMYELYTGELHFYSYHFRFLFSFSIFYQQIKSAHKLFYDYVIFLYLFRHAYKTLPGLGSTLDFTGNFARKCWMTYLFIEII